METEDTLRRVEDMHGKSLFLDLMLTVFKLAAGILGNSTALLADSIRSFQDFTAGTIKHLDCKIALKSEDSCHNYGHGKITTLFKGVLALIILLTGFQVLLQGMEELIIVIAGTRVPSTPDISAFFAAALIPLSKGIFHFYGKKESKQLRPDRSGPSKYVSLREEIVFSGCILLGIGFTFLPGRGWAAADPLAAVLLSFYALRNSARELYGTADELVEASLDEESNLDIKKIINKTEGVISCRDLKTRRIGKNIAINVSISVNDTLNIKEAEKISGRVEERLKIAYGKETYTLIKAEPDRERECPFRKISKLSENGKGKILISKN